MKKAKMTLDKLAVMINNGFQANQDHIIKHVTKHVDDRIDRLETKFDNEMTDVKLRLDNMALKIDQDDLKTRVKFIEGKLGIRPKVKNGR